MYKKSIAMLLCALMLSSAFVSCGDSAEVSTGAEDTADTSAVVETVSEEEQKKQEKEAYYAALPAVVEEGAQIDIISGTWVDISAEELTGQKFNDALYNRNLEVEERLGVKIVEHRQDDRGSIPAMIQNNVTAGDGTFDAISNMTKYASKMFVSNLLVDMKTVPNLQVKEAWWNQSANENFTINDFSFCLISSLCQNADDVAAIILFNKDMCVDYNLGLPYDDVKEGKWTYDRMWEMVEGLPLDSNGDGSMDDRDIMGIVGQVQDVQASMIACGVDFFTKDENDIPQFILDKDELNATKFETLFNVFSNRQRTVVVEYYGLENVWGFWGEKFVSGEALFFPNFPCNLAAYTEMEDDYGILPMPKFDENQKNYRAMTSLYYTSCLALPKVVDADPGDIGLTLDALSYLSYADVDPEYVSAYLENRYLRDEDSAEMMTIALHNTYFDPGFAMHYQWGKPLELLSQVVGSGENTFASTIASKAESIQNKVNATKDLIP